MNHGAGDAVLGVVADIGGTHARFATAILSGERLELRDLDVLHTGDFPSLETAFAAYATDHHPSPRRAAFAIAAPLGQDDVKLTNNDWRFRQSLLKDSLGIEAAYFVNDFAAIAHAVPHCPESDFRSLTQTAFVLPRQGSISIVGPGTGLGVGLLIRQGERDMVVPSEGGHIGFAPPDAAGIEMLRALLEQQPRISAERILCGDGLVHVYDMIATGKGTAAPEPIALWDAAINGNDPLANAARDRWLYLLGMFAGDIALAHGGQAVVLAGGILPRLGARLTAEVFLSGFCNKGRFAAAMAKLPVALLCAAQPGPDGRRREF